VAVAVVQQTVTPQQQVVQVVAGLPNQPDQGPQGQVVKVTLAGLEKETAVVTLIFGVVAVAALAVLVQTQIAPAVTEVREHHHQLVDPLLGMLVVAVAQPAVFVTIISFQEAVVRQVVVAALAVRVQMEHPEPLI
jgi:hypothetical protein